MIKTVEVANFRKLYNLDLNLGHTTLVVGHNGAGKSSIAAAIEFALTGACRWTDKRGAGYRLLISHGAETATVSLSSDGVFGFIERQLAASGTELIVDNREGSKAKAQLTVALPPPELLNAMLRSEGFITLPPKEQQEILFSLADDERTSSKWFREQLSAAECEALDEALSSRATGWTLVESLHQAAYSLRTAANKRAKTAQTQATAFQVPPKAKGNEEELKASIGALRTMQASLLEQLGAANAIKASIDKADARAQQAQKEVDLITEQWQALDDIPVHDEVDRAEATKIVAAYKYDADEAAKLRVAAEATLKARNEQLERFRALDGSCVIGAVTCPLKAEERLFTLQEEEAAIQRLEDELAALTEKANEAQQAYQAAEAQLDELKAAIAEVGRREQLAVALGQAKAKLEEADNEVIELSKSETDSTELTASLTSLEEELAEAEKQLEAIRNYSSAVAEKTQLKKAAEEAAAYADLLDGLVKKLSPTGLPAEALDSVTADIIGDINEVLTSFTDFQLVVTLDDSFTLAVKRDGYLTPVIALSESEGLRVGAAIQVAFAIMTGFNFVIVDAADRLDNSNRAALLTMLANNEQVQSLVLATPANPLSDQQKEVLNKMGIKVVEIEEGVIVNA